MGRALVVRLADLAPAALGGSPTPTYHVLGLATSIGMCGSTSTGSGAGSAQLSL